jgi:pimeloyl-ACP methyl ester carboxylesterase
MTCLAGFGQTNSDASLHFLSETGPYAVGLKVVEQYDHARLFQAGLARPLQTLVWYPAQKNHLQTMTVRDYLALMESEITFDKPSKTPDSKQWIEMLKASLDQPLWAVRNAPLEAGRYPVIIYAPSFSSTSWENADLCEYLASYGYVVVASPAIGEKTRESTHDLAAVEAQARDVSFLVGYAQSLPDTNMARVAAMGFSWGGLANLFAASRDNRIDAVVSLDGSERYFPGLVKTSGNVHPEQMTIPFLYFQEGDQSLEDQDHLNTRFHSEGPSVLNEWVHGDLITVRMLGLIHPEFCSMAFRNAELWKSEFQSLQVADYDREDGVHEYFWVAQYARAFLDAYLKQDVEALKLLRAKPSANGVPMHTMSAKLRMATLPKTEKPEIPPK